MLALQGVYENGVVTLDNTVSMKKARVIVVFQEEINRKATIEEMKLFDEFSGCIDGNIDEKKEILEALDEKYESID